MSASRFTETSIMEIFSTFFYYILGGVVIYITIKTRNYINKRKQMRSKIKSINLKAQTYRQKLEETLLIEGKLLDEARQQIVQLPVKVLLQKLQDGTLSCIEVLKAYQAKALEITKEKNCVTQFIQEAEGWAKNLDQATHKQPLHGLPISIKDNVSITGYDSTTGISIRIGLPAEEDASLLAALRSLGAIPFCTTNIPQTMLSFGCSNPVWGLTKNPINNDRTPGGSSGGEGCLIGAGGSPLGVGSDIGGSARIPAAFCGIASVKPTSKRFSYKGFTKSAKGCVGVDSVPGLMARDVETVIHVSQLLLKESYHSKYDPDVLPIPWNEQIFSSNKKLRIGFYEDDGFFPSTPGVRRSVRIACETLKKLGHEIVPFQPQKVDYALNAFSSIIQADQAKYLLEALSAEDIDPLLRMSYLGMKMPHFIRPFLSPIIGWASPRLIPTFMGAGGYKLKYSYQLWDAIQKKAEFRAEFLSSWRAKGLDLCIAPSFACPAPLSKDTGRLLPAVSYTMLYNFLDLPVGIVPVTHENEDDQAQLKDYNHKDAVCRLVKQTTRGATGIPLCIQMIGLPYQEEMVFRGMQALDSALRP